MITTLTAPPLASPPPPHAAPVPLTTLRSETCTAKVFGRAGDVPSQVWRESFGQSWKDFAYYRLLEETMQAGFIYRYLVL